MAAADKKIETTGLLGWIVGGMLVDDVVLKPYTASYGAIGHYGAAFIGAVCVVAVGKFLARRPAEVVPAAEEPIDLVKPTIPEEKTP